jgi:hypothetical protein
MSSRPSLAQRRVAAHFLARLGGAKLSGAVLVVGASLASGCLVSFDGYQPLDGAAGSGNVAAVGDTGGSAAQAGTKSNGGTQASGGSSATAGTESMGGEAPNGGGAMGGTATGGAATGGAATGGSANGGSANGGKAGSSNGGAAGTMSGGTANGGSAGTGGGGNTCPVNLKGPPMIEIPKPGGGIYCMDRTEVTSSDYKLFLDAAVVTTGQGTECSWNTTYQPDTSSSSCAVQPYDPDARPKVPISCVDWCDAKRYCGWAGKRLCGAIGGGSNPPSSYIDANADQWYRACSKAGTLKFPYGNVYQPMSCIGIDSPYVDPASVASAPSCQGGYDGLFDLSGNVAEWEDSCSAAAGASDACLTRGGSVLDAESTAPSLLCDDSALSDTTPSPATAKRSTKDEMIGFRCCYDP